MNHWLHRAPRTSLDWLILAAGASAAWLLVGALPGAARGLATFLGVLTPFALGLVLAYVLDIPTRFFTAKLFRGRRAPGIALSYLALAGVVTALAWLVVPQLMQSVTHFLSSLDDYTATLTALLDRLGLGTASTETLLDGVGADLQSMLGNVGQWAGAAAGAAAGALDFFLGLAISVYLLVDKERLLGSLRLTLRAALPPKTAGNVTAVCALANRTFNSYIGGQLVDALLVGVETFALMCLLGLGYAPLIAVLVAVTNIIPVLGPFIGAVPGALLLLLESPWQAVEFVLIVLVVQQIDGNFIAPHILGGATGLSGLGVLFAILAGGELFGIPGMLVAVPTLAVLVALARQALGAGQTYRVSESEIEE